jgi:acetyl-CoA carboxylase biotin carboxyl carrier protein
LIKDQTHDDVLEILTVLDTADLDYFELRTGDTVIVANRAGVPAAGTVHSDRSARSSPADPPAQASAPAPAPALAPVPAPAPPENDLVEVTAPIVGIFYRSPEPGAAPFAEIGDEVSAGATLGLIEVMKMFNSVTAPVAGRVVGIAAATGDFVEFGQPLLQIAPSAAT